MPKIIAVGNQKGGVGKSTVTMLAATALSQPPFNYSVTVIDIDRQQSISDRRKLDLHGFTGVIPYPVETLNFKTFQFRANELYSRYDLIFLDVAGKLDTEQASNSEAVQALQYVDVLLIPFTPGNFALSATLEYLRIALAVKQQRPDLEIYGFRNMHRERSRHGAALAEEIDELTQITAIPIMQAPLKRYSEFEDADTITSLYAPDSASPARQNFAQWIDELNKILTNG